MVWTISVPVLGWGGELGKLLTLFGSFFQHNALSFSFSTMIDENNNKIGSHEKKKKNYYKKVNDSIDFFRNVYRLLKNQLSSVF